MQSPLYEHLRLVMLRPGMYLGEHPMEALQPYLDGFRAAQKAYGQDDPVLERMNLKRMSDHFAKELGLPNTFSGESAYKMVRYVCPNERLALEEFVRLLDGFLRVEGVHLPEPTISDEILARRNSRAESDE